MASSSQEYQLVSPPDDGITNVVFAPQSNNLLMSSWDGTVRMYDTGANQQLVNYSHQGAVLDCAWIDEHTVCSGGLDRAVRLFNLQSGAEIAAGQHEKAVKAVAFSQEHQCVVSGSWDATAKVWDPRQGMAAVHSCTQPDKVFSMALSFNRILVATGGRKVFVWDMRNLAEPEQRRESSLKYQTRCVRPFIDGAGYTLASTEGRVAIEYFDTGEAVQAKKYAFKCHRRTDQGVDHVYPVNALAHHPRFGTFATGGADCLVNLWDGKNKKRLCQLRRYPTSIAALNFNQDGSLLAIAASYTFEEGQKEHPNDSVFVRTVSDVEVMPKTRPQ